MGGEFGAESEWNHEQELDWGLASTEGHAGVQRFVGDLNALLTSTPALFDRDNDPAGFRWIIGDDAASSVYAFLRLSADGEPLLFVANFTPVVRTGYRVGVSVAGEWAEVLNSDDLRYGGSAVVNGSLITDDVSTHGYDQSLELTLPPLAAIFLKPAVA